MRKSKITLAILAMAILTGFTILAMNSGVAAHSLDFSTPKLQSTASKLKSVNIQYEQLNSKLDKQTTNDKQTIEKQKKQLQNLKQQQDNLTKQLQAKADEKQKLQVAAANAANTVTATSTASADTIAPSGVACGDNSYASYIYQHESGCSTGAMNSIGCYGLGQACPGTKMGCGEDYACQNEYFTNYAISRYGSWEQAYYFWVSNHWW